MPSLQALEQNWKTQPNVEQSAETWKSLSSEMLTSKQDVLASRLLLGLSLGALRCSWVNQEGSHHVQTLCLVTETLC